MAEQRGTLSINRRRITLVPGPQTIDTGLTIPEGNYDPDPPLSGSPVIASRVMVIPHPPFTNWRGVTHDEPTVNPATGHVEVVFTGPVGGGGEVVVTFWNPHSECGPVSADTYIQPG